MKILHVVPSYLPAVRYGGPIFSVHGLASAQAALGHEVEVFTTNADGPGVSPVPVGEPVDLDGVAVTYFAVGSPRRLFRAPAMKAALARRAREFDVVHLHSVFLWPTLVAARAAHSAGVPYLLSPRGMLVGELIRAKSALVKRLWLALFEKRTIRDASALHFTAARETEDFRAMGLTAARTFEIPNGVGTVATGDAVSADVAAAIAGAPYALFLGRLNWKKNLTALIEAMRGVPAMRLLIAGNDEENHVAVLRDAIAAHDMASRTTLIARSVGEADKAALYGSAALFVLPSINENFGNTALEAMAHGVPVVVSEAAGVAEAVRVAGAGIVASPNAGSLEQAIAVLAGQPDRAARMARAGKAAARHDFGWPAVAARMIDAYSAIRARRP